MIFTGSLTVRFGTAKLCSFWLLGNSQLNGTIRKQISAAYPLIDSSTILLNPKFAIYSMFSFCTATHKISREFSSSPAVDGYSSDITVTRIEDDGDNDDDDDDDDSSEEYGFIKESNIGDDVMRDVKSVLNVMKESGDSCVELKNRIEQCGIVPSHELVSEVLHRVRNNWEQAFAFFVWAGKQPCYAHSLREYHSMIFIFGKMRKFNEAWALIDEMRGVKTGVWLVTKQTLVIMIRRYCAAHDVGRAISTFHAYKRYKFELQVEDFHSLLSALCRYKNVQDAEHLLFCNRDVFPFDTKSFNIVLNGWCTAIGSPREAERIWGEMSKRNVRYDLVSYVSIISCYSKRGNLYKVLNFFKRIKGLGFEPDRKVYNAVIHALAKGRLVNEAVSLMRSMEEKGISPNTVTYNSLIGPLCKARKIDEARRAFDEMLLHGISPTIRTYHPFLRITRSCDEAFALLENMKEKRCLPTNDTFIMLIRKFCRWRAFDNVFKLWSEMNEHQVVPDRSSYIVMVHGLFLNGRLKEASEFYADMKKNFLPDPVVDDMLRAWSANSQIAGNQTVCPSGNQGDTTSSSSGKQPRAATRQRHREKKFLRQPETRRVVREGGFSFWDQ